MKDLTMIGTFNRNLFFDQWCQYMHGTIIRTGITCKKIPCYMRDLVCRWFIVKKVEIF